jgi:hypothetical protein
LNASVRPLAFPFANGVVLTTHAQCDAHGQAKISPDDVSAFGLHDTDWGITWMGRRGVREGQSTVAPPAVNRLY